MNVLDWLLRGPMRLAAILSDNGSFLERAELQARERQHENYKSIAERMQCPDCGTKYELYKGPEGGMSVNVLCGLCGSRFNVTPPMGAAERTSKDLKWLQRIRDISVSPTYPMISQLGPRLFCVSGGSAGAISKLREEIVTWVHEIGQNESRARRRVQFKDLWSDMESDYDAVHVIFQQDKDAIHFKLRFW